MKVLYRILVPIFVFGLAIFYFGSNMQETVFHADKELIEMQNMTLPVVTMLSDGEQMNLMHGYCSNLDVMLMRENITPVTESKTLEIVIDENAYNIKKVNYEIYETVQGAKVEEGSVISLDKRETEDGSGEERKVAKIHLTAEYAENAEYVARLTLISNESKRIYYYTRIKVYNKSNLREKIEFAKMFHSSLLDKGLADSVKRYLETEKGVDETDFSKANIHNSLDFLSYGELAPSVLFEAVPTVTEYTKDMASVMLESYVQIQSETAEEVYRVIENLRFRYTSTRTYLYNYERTMEAVFDVNNTSLAKSEFKLGITAQTTPNALTNADHTRIAFVENDSLYVYTAADNLLTTAFSFREETTDYIRDCYDKHGIRILDVDTEGAVDFLVYGYMNRGEYEGRVGMILYTYHPFDQSIEERAYFPMNTTYDILKETLGDFAYCNPEEIFYFHIYDTIYTYNLVTGELKVLAEQVSENRMVYSPEKKMIAWQSEAEYGHSDTVHLYDLDAGIMSEIKAENDRIIGLLGLIDTNLVVGKTSIGNVDVAENGVVTAAYDTVEIVDFEGNSYKNYHRDGYYIVSVKTEDNVITLERVVPSTSGSNRFVAAESDHILNQQKTQKQIIGISTRVTERMKKERYLSLPSSVTIAEIPKTEGTMNTVITKNVTVRVNTPEYFRDFYITYAYGNIKTLEKEPGRAIGQADELTGSVIDSSGRVIWSRSAKANSSELKGIKAVTTSNAGSSLKACVKMLLAYRSVDAEIISNYRKEEQLLTVWLQSCLNANVLSLTETDLDEALYFVYKGNPLIAVDSSGEALLISGYDSNSVTAIFPETGKERKISRSEMTRRLGKSGFYYIAIE